MSVFMQRPAPKSYCYLNTLKENPFESKINLASIFSFPNETRAAKQVDNCFVFMASLSFGFHNSIIKPSGAAAGGDGF